MEMLWACTKSWDVAHAEPTQKHTRITNYNKQNTCAEQALQFVTHRAGTQAGYIPLSFDEEEEQVHMESVEDMTKNEDKVVHKYIQTYNKAL